MKKIILFLFIVFPGVYCSAQQAVFSVSPAQTGVNNYTLKIRTQFRDTVVFCDCPQQANAQDQGGEADCNPLSDVMINVYQDTNLVRTYFTNETGYCRQFQLPEAKYTLVFHSKNYDDAKLLVDLTTTGLKNIIVPLTGNPIHYQNQGSNYFICVILNGKGNKHGVRIIPKKN